MRSPSSAQRTQRLAPWLIAGAAIGLVFWRVPVEEAWNAARGARLDLFLPLVIGASSVWFLLETACVARLVSRVSTPLSGRECRRLRGATYLLTPIHWHLGRAALVLRLRREKQVPMVEGASSLLLCQTIDAAILGLLITIGLAMLPAAPQLTGLGPIVGGVLVGLVVYLALVRAPELRARALEGLRTASLHHAHRNAHRSDLLVVVALRAAYQLLFVLVYYLGIRAFGADPPFALVLAAVPIIQLIGSLPISPAGLGTQQAAMLYFFAGEPSGHGAEAAIVAFGFAFPLALIASRCLIGLVYLPGLPGLPGLPERLGLDSRSDRKKAESAVPVPVSGDIVRAERA